MQMFIDLGKRKYLNYIDTADKRETDKKQCCNNEKVLLPDI